MKKENRRCKNGEREAKEGEESLGPVVFLFPTPPTASSAALARHPFPLAAAVVIYEPRGRESGRCEVSRSRRELYAAASRGRTGSYRVAVAAMSMAFVRSYSSASSGMGVAAECKEMFLELQRKKAHRYVIFKIDEKGKDVVVEKTGAVTESFDDFLSSLPETDCRYAIYDFDFVTEENCQKSKIFFIAWSPSVSRIRSKMLYATSKQQFRRELDGVHYEIQATDPSELDIEVLRDRAH